LYELLTGTRVFHAATLAQRSLAGCDAEDLVRSTDIDPRIKDVIVRCLKRDPAERPRSVRSLADGLPGGADPLLAALATGQIPSPEMVAAAGDTRSLRPMTAAVCLGLAIIGLFTAAWQIRPMLLYRQVTLTKPPDALAERARQVVTRMGYTEPPVDSEYWFTNPQTPREMASKRSALYDAPSRAPRASGLFFVYRQSPTVLVPENALGVIQYREPPADVPGMADVTLDSTGHLLRFTAVPPRGSPTPRAPDWVGAFSEAGLDYRVFKPRARQWSPPVAHDLVATWEGTAADRPAEPIFVGAAAWNGQPAAVEMTPGTASETTEASVESGGSVSQLTFLIMTIAALVGSGILARWNIRQGRWDRSGALKVATYVFGMGLLVGLLRADHVPRVRDEYLIFVRIASWNLYYAGFT